jgi:two-component system response regulator GlrR
MARQNKITDAIAQPPFSAVHPANPRLEAACVTVGLIGCSPAFQRVLSLVERLAAYDAPVLICGPTGSGKELFASCVHSLSSRQGMPFVPVNCGALPDMLLESELFGHMRGAFTDAKQDQLGLVAIADGGTLFLDEVDSLTAKAQVALLRFLEDHEYRPVGGRTLLSANVRIVSASNRDLAAAVAAGHFRQDLLFRLDVLNLTLPSLRERREDIGLLARFFLRRFAAAYDQPEPEIDPAAGEWLAGQAWPGNVRELENRMHRAFVLSVDGRVTRAVLEGAEPPDPDPLQTAASLYGLGLKAARDRETHAFEARYLRQLVVATNGNVSEAARRAGVERRTMGRLLKRHGLTQAETPRKRILDAAAS